MSKLKVLFHINEADRWPVALGNITNLVKDVGEETVEIIVLANGPAVLAYSDERTVAIMQECNKMGTTFKACRNSLKKLCASGNVCMTDENLPLFVEIVPAGITEIIKRQAEGFAYVKP